MLFNNNNIEILTKEKQIGEPSSSSNSSQTSELNKSPISISSPIPTSITPPPSFYQYNQNDEFYMAPPTCQFLHYRDAAVMVGIFEVLMIAGTLFGSLNFYLNIRLFGIWSPLLISTILCIAIGTTIIMIYGIKTEQPQLLWPQIYFLKLEISLLLAGAVFSISSMCLGMEYTNWIFSHFVRVDKMEQVAGPIWPFNIAIISFSGAAIGIWFDVIVRGCYDYLLDKEYFTKNLNQPAIDIKQFNK
ncbi:hypothetical protein Mgra_00007224 [Meloidogyne graminicola]|uniref:Uncharacterized protein n=1 Tax=Meloidogyne graminicola TaxID=189291 RepID=A0A8S9ZJJ8_9BILA|nr:hypothetical protein Mgra_00007224 [Meloidogyne graminicola]